MEGLCSHDSFVHIVVTSCMEGLCSRGSLVHIVVTSCMEGLCSHNSFVHIVVTYCVEGFALTTVLFTLLSHLVWRASLSQQFCSHCCHILCGGLRSHNSFVHIVVTSCVEGFALTTVLFTSLSHFVWRAHDSFDNTAI